MKQEIIIISPKELKAGKRFCFDNSAFQESIRGNDLRGAEIWHDSNLPGWISGFKIQFNGQLVHSSKTFKSMLSRLNKLINTWNLELIDN